MAQENELLQEQANDSDLVKQLRSELRNRDGLIKEQTEELGLTKSQLTEISKKDVFRSVGIDPTKGANRLLFENYNGEMTAEAVKEAAAQYDIPTGDAVPSSESQTQEVPSSEREAHDKMNGAAAGAGSPAPVDANALGREAYERVFNATGNDEEARAAMFNAKMMTALAARKG